MRQHRTRALGMLCAAALVLAACGSEPEESTNDNSSGGNTSAGTTPSTPESESTSMSTGSTGQQNETPQTTAESENGGSGSSGAETLACMVTDTGGIDDRSFNASAWKGVQDAMEDLGVKGKYVSSSSAADYVPNINAFVQQGCDLILTVGFLMGDYTKNAAQENPDQNFAIVDFSYDPPLDNVLGLIYNTAQAGFLGGYLAAGMTDTGTVATFGGQKLPTVTIYMDGYVQGVHYYNQKHGTSVEVLGWDPDTQNGVFTNSFTDQAAGKQLALQFQSQGADIVFPVAGPVGLGAAKAAAQSNGELQILWVDTNGCVSAPRYCGVMLGSVVKGIAASVEKAIKEVKTGSFSGGQYVGTLENGGTGLVLGKELGSTIPQSLQDEIQQAKKDIISGTIEIKSPSQPATP